MTRTLDTQPRRHHIHPPLNNHPQKTPNHKTSILYTRTQHIPTPTQNQPPKYPYTQNAQPTTTKPRHSNEKSQLHVKKGFPIRVPNPKISAKQNPPTWCLALLSLLWCSSLSCLLVGLCLPARAFAGALCAGWGLVLGLGEGCAHICSHGWKSVRTQLAGLRVRNNGANEDTRRQRGPRHKREPNQRAWVGGLLTPDGCIDVWWYLDWSPATYRLRSLRSLRLVPASSWFGLGWGLCTVWWQVCAHGGGMGCACGVE